MAATRLVLLLDASVVAGRPLRCCFADCKASYPWSKSCESVVALLMEPFAPADVVVTSCCFAALLCGLLLVRRSLL